MNSRNSFLNSERLRQIAGSTVVRFVFGGVANTGSTYVLYLLLLLFLDYQVAYGISYVAGIAVAYLLNSRLVFRSGFSVARMAVYPLIYLFQYAANAGLLELFVRKLGLAEQLAPLLAICITMPIVFLLNKLVLTAKARPR